MPSAIFNFFNIGKYKIWPYLLVWTLVNLVQANFTELFHDEAHYWMFSQHLAWGYWDHPPAAPVFIFLGTVLFPGEMGVRLFTVLASTATIYVLYRVVRPDQLPLFFSLLFSILLIHIGGFMASPDVFLLFFAALFLLVLRQYLKEDSWKTALLLGLLTTGLAYSKYHGAVFLLFLLIPNWRLIKRLSFWLIPVLATVLFLPHLYWQYRYDFPTFRYHLIDRGAEVYEWHFVWDYLGGQLVVFGPIIGILILLSAFRRKPADSFERSLKWCMCGILGFFLYRSFFERTEANWTATALLPAIYLSYQFVALRINWQKWVFRLMLPSLLLCGGLRLYFMWDFLPGKMNPRNEFHGWDQWAEDLSEVADTLPIVFYNSYRNPSKYQFYSNKKAHTINVWSHSGNQYDLLWEEEEKLQGQSVLLVNEYLPKGIPINPGGLWKTRYLRVEDFRSYNRLRIKILNPVAEMERGSTQELEIVLKNPTTKKVDFSESTRPVYLYAHVYDGEKVIVKKLAMPGSLNKINLAPGASVHLKVTLFAPVSPGNYRYRFTLHIKDLHNGRQANFYNLLVD
ncbi:MAG: glycosyltransferase family 39 protein [Saprospiraceae bacterium]|nr:glycosyltransferase family 39 protein [Saprospiraceae bacterium]